MDRKELFDALLLVAKQKTSTADVVLGEDGKPTAEPFFEGESFGENVIVVA
jgi:hypothetical protein